MQPGRKDKSRQRWVLWVLLTLLTALMMQGCGPSGTVTKETDERAYRRGKSLLREGRNDEALQAFLTVLNSRPDATESHLEAGLIYLNHIKDPLAAIYHFRNYLAMAPQGEYAEFVEELILTAQKEYAKTLPGEPFGDAVDRVNLMETVSNLRDENTVLKQRIADLQQQLVDKESQLQTYSQAVNQMRTEPAAPGEMAPIVIQTASRPPAPTPSAQTYTVQAGDTLSRISAKVYGVSNRWTEIFEANRDQLPSPNALQPGQVLKIPQ